MSETNKVPQKEISYRSKFIVAIVSLLLFVPISYVSYFDIKLSQNWSDFLHIPSGLGMFGLAATYGLFTEKMKQMYRILLLSAIAGIFISAGYFLYEYDYIGRKAKAITMVIGIVTAIGVLMWSFLTWEQIMAEVRNSGASKPLGVVFLLLGIVGTSFLTYNFDFFVSLQRNKMVVVMFMITIGLIVSGFKLLCSSNKNKQKTDW